MDVPATINPLAEAGRLEELWSPRVLARVNDQYVKVAKVKGTLTWHTHANEDELFYVLQGRLRLELERDRAVELNPGEFYVVPKGVRHNPVAEEECLVLLVETVTTEHTGDVVMEKTRSIAEQLGSLSDGRSERPP
jgi:mannose-6-phosphate isomerase-like protein (cupin superfamily)